MKTSAEERAEVQARKAAESLERVMSAAEIERASLAAIKDDAEADFQNAHRAFQTLRQSLFLAALDIAQHPRTAKDPRQLRLAWEAVSRLGQIKSAAWMEFDAAGVRLAKLPK